MIGLLIRILVLCSVVFAVVFAITRALRVSAQNRHIARIEEEIRSLRDAVLAGAVDAEDYAVRADRIRRACAQAGIDVPELPPRLLPRNERDS
jgi:uncharacterized membrane protein